MTVTVGRIVHYQSKHGGQDAVTGVIDRWGGNPDGTASGVTRPDGLVPVLPDDTTVDLLVHGLGGDYREYAVPFKDAPGGWTWPPRV